MSVLKVIAAKKTATNVAVYVGFVREVTLNGRSRDVHVNARRYPLTAPVAAFNERISLSNNRKSLSRGNRVNPRKVT